MSGVSFNDTTDKAGASGANPTLSNLTSDATAINTGLVPNSDSSYYLGSSTFSWGRLYVGQLRDAANTIVMSAANRILINANGDNILNWATTNLLAIKAHISTVQTTAPVAVAQASAGVLATAVVSTGSTDTNGKITLTTTAVTGSGNIIVTTFDAAYAAAPDVILQPGNSAAAAFTAGASGIYVTSTTTTFTIVSDGTLDDTTEYIWYYHILGR